MMCQDNDLQKEKDCIQDNQMIRKEDPLWRTMNTLPQ